MLTIRVDNETMEMKAFLKQHNVRWQPEAKALIKNLMAEKCRNFKRKKNRIKDAPYWLYDD